MALQTYPHIEILVAAASGRDHIPVGAWQGRFPARLIPSSEPLPRARAANLGIDRAHGQYLMILDNDSALHPQHIAALGQTLRKVRWTLDCMLLPAVEASE